MLDASWSGCSVESAQAGPRLAGGFVDLVEGFNCVQHLLHLGDVEVAVQHFIEIEIADLRATGEDVCRFAVGRDQAGSIELDLAVLADDTELDSEPEESRHAVQILLARQAGANVT